MDQSPLGLTPREFQILDILIRRRDQVVSPADLIEAMWGTADVGDVRPVHVYVSRLRKKLHDAGVWGHLIETVRGRGYRYSASEHGHLIPAHGISLDYDDHLILRAIDPDDRPFLGWQPSEVIDTFFLLTSVTALHSSRRAALAVARLWAAIGMLTSHGATSVRTAQGTNIMVIADMTLRTRNRRFLGLEACIRPIDHRL